MHACMHAYKQELHTNIHLQDVFWNAIRTDYLYCWGPMWCIISSLTKIRIMAWFNQNNAIFQWFIASLSYLQCISNGETAVLYLTIDFKCPWESYPRIWLGLLAGVSCNPNINEGSIYAWYLALWRGLRGRLLTQMRKKTLIFLKYLPNDVKKGLCVYMNEWNHSFSWLKEFIHIIF